jgi:REP element-mobilizing transposase RayT
MARPLRIEFEGALYHLCARGNERQQVYRDERDRAEFVRMVEGSSRRYQVSVLGFVLLGNHFHLIAQTHQANLSRWMHWLMVSYTVYFNWRHRRSGHLFQGRYKSFLVEAESGDYLLELSRYVHLNPVRGKSLGKGNPAQRRERLRSFKWSSYPGYAGLRRQFGFVEEKQVLEQMEGKSASQRHLSYRRFVEEGLLREIEAPWERVRWQSVLGSESFGRRVQDRINAMSAHRREIRAVREGESLLDPMKVVKRVAKAYGEPLDRIKEDKSYGLEARNVAMWLVWNRSGLGLRQIGEFFGGLHYSAVAQRLRRISPKLQQKAEKLVPQM